MAAAVATQRVLADYAIKMADEATKATQKLVETSKKKAEPHVQTTRALFQEHVQPQVDKTHDYYKEHMKPHVDKHAAPVYYQYIAPLLEKGAVLVKKGWKESKALAKLMHSKLVTRYIKSCPNTLKQLKKMQRAPEFMVSHVKQSCQNAEKTVNTFLWTILALFVFIFRCFLRRTVVGMLLLPIRIIWFFSPLRLFFGKREPTLEEETNGLSEDESPTAR